MDRRRPRTRPRRQVRAQSRPPPGSWGHRAKCPERYPSLSDPRSRWRQERIAKRWPAAQTLKVTFSSACENSGPSALARALTRLQRGLRALKCPRTRGVITRLRRCEQAILVADSVLWRTNRNASRRRLASGPTPTLAARRACRSGHSCVGNSTAGENTARTRPVGVRVWRTRIGTRIAISRERSP